MAKKKVVDNSVRTTTNKGNTSGQSGNVIKIYNTPQAQKRKRRTQSSTSSRRSKATMPPMNRLNAYPTGPAGATQGGIGFANQNPAFTQTPRDSFPPRFNEELSRLSNQVNFLGGYITRNAQQPQPQSQRAQAPPSDAFIENLSEAKSPQTFADRIIDPVRNQYDEAGVSAMLSTPTQRFLETIATPIMQPLQPLQQSSAISELSSLPSTEEIRRMNPPRKIGRAALREGIVSKPLFDDREHEAELARAKTASQKPSDDWDATDYYSKNPSQIPVFDAQGADMNLINPFA